MPDITHTLHELPSGTWGYSILVDGVVRHTQNAAPADIGGGLMTRKQADELGTCAVEGMSGTRMPTRAYCRFVMDWGE